MNNNEKEDSLTLEILETIEQQSDVTQRHLADTLGVALGLTNSYLKRCVRKGYVKIKQVPANRYLYYLTPKGFTEKSRLTALYLSRSFDFYRDASHCIDTLYKRCKQNDWYRLLFFGVSELAEIAFIRANEFDVEIVGTLDLDTNKETFLSLSVWHELADIPICDAFFITGLDDIRAKYDYLKQEVGTNRILIPEILGFRLPDE